MKLMFLRILSETFDVRQLTLFPDLDGFVKRPLSMLRGGITKDGDTCIFSRHFAATGLDDAI